MDHTIQNQVQLPITFVWVLTLFGGTTMMLIMLVLTFMVQILVKWSWRFEYGTIFRYKIPLLVSAAPPGLLSLDSGRNQCYPGCTLEYKGYLVAGEYTLQAASEFVCLDDRPDVVISGTADRNGRLFYFAEGRCSLPCPPYIDDHWWSWTTKWLIKD